MSEISLRHYLCFQADNRISMDIYADSLAKIVRKDEFTLTRLRPKSGLEKYSYNRIVMRYLRYWSYPRMAKGDRSEIHHVLDQGYAHLYPYFNHIDERSISCITVHDLIPMLTWNGHIRSAKGEKIAVRKPWLSMKSLSSVYLYDRVITVSESTKRDLINYFGIKPDKISTIPPMIESFFQPCDDELVNAFASKYNFDRRCKWLMITGREHYKNHRTSLEVLIELNKQHDVDFCMVKTGSVSDEFEALVIELGLESKVKSIFLEDFRELALLYGLIDCLLFPSLYEGFGMPVAEALACGTPVVTSDRGSLPEVAGSLGAICDAGDVEELTKEVTSMIFDKSRVHMISTHGPKWVEQFREEALGSKLSDFYHSAISSNESKKSP